jgi:hypothetical protein
MKRILVLIFYVLICWLNGNSQVFHFVNRGALVIKDNLAVKGDFVNDGGTINDFGPWLNPNGNLPKGVLHLYCRDPLTVQQVIATQPINIDHVVLNSLGNTELLYGELNVSTSFKFKHGILSTDRTRSTTSFVHFLPGSQSLGHGLYGYIDGVVRKSGSTNFEFPLGNAGHYAPTKMVLHVSQLVNPGSPLDHFTAWYNYQNPNAMGYNTTSKHGQLDFVSDCEFWEIHETGRTNTINPQFGLSYSSRRNSVHKLPPAIQVANWDALTGTSWNFATGNPSFVGDRYSGYVFSNYFAPGMSVSGAFTHNLPCCPADHFQSTTP